jgi:hypothetical protein
MSRRATRPRFTGDLSPAERSFSNLLQQLRFGHLESLKIKGGELVLDPVPRVVQVLRLGTAEVVPSDWPAEFQLKKSLADFFEFVRGVDDGEIRCLQVRHGLPFSMQVEHCMSRGMPDVKGEHVDAV